MSYDLKITGGTIVDGSGKARYPGDVGVRNGRIVALGNAPDAARQTIDAEGAIVSPGFVDLHTHYDAQIIWDRMVSISPWHGVTSVVMGNCGFGVAPTRAEHRDMIVRTMEKVEGMNTAALWEGLGEDWPFETFPEYLDAIDSRGVAVNVGVLLGHTPLRFYVMGEAATERAATDDELAQMTAIVREAVTAGAVGFSTSRSATHVAYDGRKIPSRVCDVEEIYALAKAVGKAGGGLFEATAGRGLFLEEYKRIAKDTGCNVSWTALLSDLSLGDGGHEEQLRLSEEIAAAGYNVFPQVTPRPLNFEYQMKEPFIFEALSLFQPVSAADFDGRKRLYQDPEFRAAFRERMQTVREQFRSSFEKTVISQCLAEPGLDEQRLLDVAKRRGMAPTDLLLDLSLADNLETRFRVPVANHNEDSVEPLLKGKSTVLGLSDAGAHASQLCDAPLPTYLLSRWVREKQVFSIEEAVRMLTSRPAQVAGLKDRGLLAEGRPADITIFDPNTVGAGQLQRVYDFPAGADRLISRESGIRAVIVNGTPIRENGADAVDPKGTLPGGVLRRRAAA